MTNADKIRAMGIDGLIEWFCYRRPCGSCPYNGVECRVRDWLNAEEEGEEGGGITMPYQSEAEGEDNGE